MDPLSITASSIAVLGVITGAGKGINKLIALRQAPANLQNLSNDIEAFRGVLLMTQMSIRRISHTKEYHDCEEALTVLLLAMQKSVLDLETKINNQLVRRDGGFDQNGFPKVAKVEWLRSGGQIKKMRQKIRDARGNLETGLAAMNLQISGHVSEQIRRTPLQIQNVSLRSPDITITQTINMGALSIEQPHNEQQNLEQRIASALNEPPAYARVIGGGGEAASLTASGPIPCEPPLLRFLDTDSTNSGIVDMKPTEVKSNIVDDTATSVPLYQDLFEGKHKQIPGSILLEVSTSIDEQPCPPFCKCQCHSRGQMRTPRVLRNMFGQLLLNYSALIRATPCNYPPCRKRPAKSQFMYYFPSWMVSRALQISEADHQLSSPWANWTYRVPIVVPSYEPLWAPVRTGNVGHLQKLFSSGEATLNMIDEDGWSLLHCAVHNRQARFGQYLLELGVDKSSEDDAQSTPADMALKENKADDFSYLLKDVADELSLTAIHRAAIFPSQSNHLSQELLDQHHDKINAIDKTGLTALHWACLRGDSYAVKLLLDWNANVNIRDRAGHSALHYACRGESANIVHESKWYEDEVIRIADAPNVIQQLIWSGADINCTNEMGHTALDQAICWSHEDNVAVLLDYSRICKERFHWRLDRYKKNSLHIAALYGSAEVIRVLAGGDLRGLDSYAKDCIGSTPTDSFYARRDSYCKATRESREDEERAWQALMLSVRQQNSPLPTHIKKAAKRSKDSSVTTVEYTLGSTDGSDFSYVDALEEQRILVGS